MTDITRGDLIKITNLKAIYCSEMDVKSEYIVLDIWRQERDVVLKVKKRIGDGKDLSFSEQVFTVSGCDVEKVNDKTEIFMDKKEPKFKIGQKVLLDAEVYEKGEGSIPVGALEILEIYCAENEYSYSLRPEMAQPEGVMPPHVYDEKWLITLSENNIGKGIEKPIIGVEVKCNKSEKGLEEAIDRIAKLAKEVRGTTPRTVNILGTDYTVVEKPIKDCDGYCDKTTKEIAVAVKEDDCDLGNFEEHRKKVLRHEVIHAYHFESGLAENFENKQYGFSETLVDWFAWQSPKIFKTFEELGIL